MPNFDRQTRSSAKKRIPKEYLAPRPMVGGAPPQPAPWRRIPWPLVAIIGAVLLTLLTPLDAIERKLLAWQLSFAGSNEVPRSTVSVEVASFTECEPLIDLLRSEAEARGVVSVSPLPELCETDSTGLDLVIVASEHLLAGASSPIGVAPSSPLAKRIGAGLVAPRDEQAIPVLSARDLISGRVSPDILRARLVVVGLASSESKPHPVAVAAVAAARLEDGTRRRLPAAAKSLLLVVLAALGAYGRSLSWLLAGRFRAPLAIYCVVVAVAVVMVSMAGAAGWGTLLPVAGLSEAFALGLVITLGPEALARSKAREQAEALLAGALQRKTFGFADDDDAQFWARLASRAEQAHPADSVLVAELPAFRWHLKIWPHDDVDESVVKERRRDIRRTPYSDERGVPITSVSKRYLVMKDWPALLVPMIAEQDVEGYLILIGPPAERAYHKAPERTEKLARELAGLARQRRLQRAQITRDSVRGAHPEQLVEETRGMLEELTLMSALFKNAPVGLLYADSFGDVRLLGTSLAALLQRMGMVVPHEEATGILPAGQLPLSRVFEMFDPNKTLADVTDDDLELGSEDDRGRAFVFQVRRLASEDAVTTGYVAAGYELPRGAEEKPSGELVQLPAERGDPLVVFSLSQVLLELIAELQQSGELNLRLQTPRTHATVVAHQSLLRRSLEDFLVDLGKRSVESPPVVTVSEREGAVELSFLDVQLGVPGGAVRRALAAPSIPPPGLAGLSSLVKAVEECHGQVRVETDEEWGVTVIVELIRARPKVRPDPSAIAEKSLSEVIDLLKR